MIEKLIGIRYDHTDNIESFLCPPFVYYYLSFILVLIAFPFVYSRVRTAKTVNKQRRAMTNMVMSAVTSRI